MISKRKHWHRYDIKEKALTSLWYQRGSTVLAMISQRTALASLGYQRECTNLTMISEESTNLAMISNGNHWARYDIKWKALISLWYQMVNTDIAIWYQSEALISIYDIKGKHGYHYVISKGIIDIAIWYQREALTTICPQMESTDLYFMLKRKHWPEQG